VAVLVVLSVSLRLLGIGTLLDEAGVDLDHRALLIYAAIIGFSGALISLALSKFMAKMTTGARVIRQPRNQTEAWLVDTVARLSRQSGIGMPEVAIFPSPEPNAFATGARRDAALVAVSEGLLQNMSRDEVEAVLGHEVAHVANGDMITMTLLQGVVNTFVIYLSRLVGHFVDRVVFRTERGHGPAFWIVALVAQIVFGLLASLIVMWFSRRREFRADAGSADLVGTEGMVRALQRLKAASEAPVMLPDGMKAFGIRGQASRGLARLLRSHPPLDERIVALRGRRSGGR
jgi:heat shock protein HtpX